MWYLYIIETRLGHWYTGICRDLARRFTEHQSSGPKCAKALRGKGPLRVLYCAEVSDHSTALKMEIWLKKLTKGDKKKFVDDTLSCALPHLRLPCAAMNGDDLATTSVLTSAPQQVNSK
jgi:putative endonuclease